MKPTLYKILPPADGVYLVNSKPNEPPTKCLVKNGRAFDCSGEVINFDCYWEYVGAVNTWAFNFKNDTDTNTHKQAEQMAFLANELAFNNYLKNVGQKTPVHECPSIHRQEHDIAYQIEHNGEFVTIGRYTPPSEYLIFDTLNLYKQSKQTTQSGNM